MVSELCYQIVKIRLIFFDGGFFYSLKGGTKKFYFYGGLSPDCSSAKRWRLKKPAMERKRNCGKPVAGGGCAPSMSAKGKTACFLSGNPL